jgi:hypothetical protein
MLHPSQLREFCSAVGAAASEILPTRPNIRKDVLLDVKDPYSVDHPPSPFDLLDQVPMIRHELSPVQMVHDGGHCYRFLFRTAAGRFFTFSPIYTRLQLFENGEPMPNAGADHVDIRNDGGGRYSLWPEGIYLSARNNSDPRTNGNTYHVFVPLYVHFLEQMPESIIRRFGL